MFEELDTVILTHDIKKYGLKKGDLGAIVLVYDDHKTFEVEFVAPTGKTIGLLTLDKSDISLYKDVSVTSAQAIKSLDFYVFGSTITFNKVKREHLNELAVIQDNEYSISSKASVNKTTPQRFNQISVC